MCGILGNYCFYENKNLINETFQRLKKLQHRGKDSYGLSYIYGGTINEIKKQGMVEETIESKHPIQQCISHVRYTTSGDNTLEQTQPLTRNNISIVHNGNIPIFKGHDTTELFQLFQNKNKNELEETLIHIMNTIVASYSLIVMMDGIFYVMKDRYGIRPLCIGQKEGQIIISSESCAIEDCDSIREVQSGQLLRIDNKGIQEKYLHPKNKDGICIFELMYFMNKESIYHNKKIETFRFELGELLAKKETLKDKDYLVIGIPSSGISAAKSFAKYLNLEYSQAIQKENEKTCDRTFILMKDSDRIQACKKKFKYDINKIKNKKIIIIDDTIVRGNVIKSIIHQLKVIGPSEIHIRIPSSPVIDICQLGIAINNKEELLMFNRSISDVVQLLNIDSLDYLTFDEISSFAPHSYKQCFGEKIDNEIISLI